METAAVMVEGAVCQPNISRAGARRRVRFGAWNTALGVVLVVALAAVHARWYWRLSVFFPAALAAVGFLQVRRKTCVAHAATGTFEHEDFSTTKAPDEDVRKSRVVATGIKRDSILIGIAAALLSAALAAL